MKCINFTILVVGMVSVFTILVLGTVSIFKIWFIHIRCKVIFFQKS